MPTKATILVIDDNPVNLRLFTQILERAGYEVQALMDGARALSVIKATPPDLILLDIIMPGINGLDICKRINADDETRGIPVLFISALDDPQEKQSAFEAGAVDYITKPIRRLEVLSRVATHLRIHHVTLKLQNENADLRARVAKLDAEYKECTRHNQELLAYDVSVAHDLKNPLSNIVTTADWLLETHDQLPKVDRDVVLANLVRTAEKANHVIESLLDLSQPGGVDIAVVETEPVINEVLDTLRPMIDKYEAQILVPDILPDVMGDRDLLTRIWDNYLSNAIKYGGKPPKVVIGYELQDEQIKYWIEDNGRGVSPDRIGRLFKPFSRLANGDYVGHGLGLYLVQRSIRALSGEVGMEPRQGGGCRFYFILPMAQ